MRQPCTEKVFSTLIQGIRYQILKIFCLDSANDVISCREFLLYKVFLLMMRDILNKTTRKIREKTLCRILGMGHSHFYVCIEICCD